MLFTRIYLCFIINDVFVINKPVFTCLFGYGINEYTFFLNAKKEFMKFCVLKF